MNVKNFFSTTGMLDLFFLTALGFVFLFMVSFLMIKPAQKDADIKTKAEYVITCTWQSDNVDDVDLWLQDPTGNIIYYGFKEAGLSHLDRDDLGDSNDVIILPDGTELSYKYNQEIITIRGFIEGEWTINVNLFSKKPRSKSDPEVEVKVEKLNPSVKTIYIGKVTLHRQGEEKTIVRITMSSNGDVLSLDHTQKDLVLQKVYGNAHRMP